MWYQLKDEQVLIQLEFHTLIDITLESIVIIHLKRCQSYHAIWSLIVIEPASLISLIPLGCFCVSFFKLSGLYSKTVQWMLVMDCISTQEDCNLPQILAAPLEKFQWPKLHMSDKAENWIKSNRITWGIMYDVYYRSSVGLALVGPTVKYWYVNQSKKKISKYLTSG